MNDLVADRYRLEHPIGGGGAASVWRAVDIRTDRPVAIKRLHARLREDDQYAERFAREATIVSNFDHPGIVKLYDRGEEDGVPFLAFELIEGEDVKTLVQRTGHLRPRRAADICAQVADALHYAHLKGVIHRDVKSQNVLLTPMGTAKLTDFGIAYLLDIDGVEDITRAGTLVGTSDYLSPEQATGKSVDARTDVYALGIVLFELLTGELPFKGDSPIALALAHVREPMPDPRTIVPDVPAYLAACALRAAAKDPRQRFQTAERMADALRAVQGGTLPIPVIDPDDEVPAEEQQTGELAAVERVRERRLGPARNPRLVAAVATVAVVAAGVGGGILLSNGGSDPAPTAGPALEVASVTVRDPVGDGENDDQAPDAIDGDAATEWRTETYDVADLGTLPKKGVGLVFNLATPAVATTLVLDTATPGARFQVIAVSATASEAERIVADAVTTGRSQRVILEDAPAASAYVVWFTGLAAIPDQASRFAASIGEVRLEGRQ